MRFLPTLAALLVGVCPAAVAQDLPARSDPRTPYDSTVAQIAALGTRVAEVRTAIDLYRRASISEPAGIVEERADRVQARCAAMAEAAERARRAICRGCVRPSARPALEGYREQLASVSQVGRRCVGRLAQLRAAPPSRALREEARPLARRIVEGLRGYEARLRELRDAMGWAAPAVAPARP